MSFLLLLLLLLLLLNLRLLLLSFHCCPHPSLPHLASDPISPPYSSTPATPPESSSPSPSRLLISLLSPPSSHFPSSMPILPFGTAVNVSLNLSAVPLVESLLVSETSRRLDPPRLPRISVCSLTSTFSSIRLSPARLRCNPSSFSSLFAEPFSLLRFHAPPPLSNTFALSLPLSSSLQISRTPRGTIPSRSRNTIRATGTAYRLSVCPCRSFPSTSRTARGSSARWMPCTDTAESTRHHRPRETHPDTDCPNDTTRRRPRREES